MKSIKNSETKKTLRGGFKRNRRGAKRKLRPKLNRKDSKRRLKMSENGLKKKSQKESD